MTINKLNFVVSTYFLQFNQTVSRSSVDIQQKQQPYSPNPIHSFTDPDSKQPNPTQPNPNNNMKLKTTLIAVLSLACTAISNAGSFSINFDTGVVFPGGTNIPAGFTQLDQGAPLVVTVNGYGTVKFENIGTNQSIFVNGNNAAFGGVPQQNLNFEINDKIRVTFAGAALESGPDWFTAGESSSLGVQDNLIEKPEGLSGLVHTVTYDGTQVQAGGAGITSVQWTVIPEPSSSALGALGMSMILLRRRR